MKPGWPQEDAGLDETWHRVTGSIRDFELAERNAEARRDWLLRKALGVAYPDAQAPVERVLVDRWLTARRDMALRWMFKSRSARRKALRGHPWAHLPKPFHRQAE